jgi:hypothetical protein
MQEPEVWVIQVQLDWLKELKELKESKGDLHQSPVQRPQLLQLLQLSPIVHNGRFGYLFGPSLDPE